MNHFKLAFGKKYTQNKTTEKQKRSKQPASSLFKNPPKTTK